MALQRTRTGPVGSGRRDRFIYLVPITQSRGPTGFPVETDGPRCGVWAYKEELSGQERFAAGQLSAPYTTTWETDYQADIDPELADVPRTFVLLSEERRFDIVTAEVIGRKAGVRFSTLARMG